MTEFTPEKQQRFLDELAKMPNVARAARLARISRQTVYLHRDADAEFAAAWDDAIECGIDGLEESAWTRAKKGSDTLTIFLLKAHRPEKYRETVRNEHTGKDGGPIELTDETRAARIAALLDAARTRRDGPIDSAESDLGAAEG